MLFTAKIQCNLLTWQNNTKASQRAVEVEPLGRLKKVKDQIISQQSIKQQNRIFKGNLIDSMSRRMMGMIRTALKQIDLFPTNSFIRYNGESEYTTSTGGFMSLIVIIIFIVLFARMGLLTLNQQIIQSSVSTANDVTPSMFKIVTSPDQNFMFSVNIFGFNLNNPLQKLFNITLTQYFYGTAFSPINQTQIPLVPCTPAHYSFLTNQSQFYRLGFHNGLCPPIGYEFTVGGKPTSTVYSEFLIVVDRCNSTINPTCASTAVLTSILSNIQDFTLIVPVVSMQFNPGSAVYKTAYLEDRNFFNFNLDMGVVAKGSIAEVIVQTDKSIMPFQQIASQSFSVLPNLLQALPYLMTPAKPYAKIAFNKATYTTTYSRSFNKVDTYFSYVGGLIGTIIGFIFILNFYTQKAYQISIANKLFKDSEGEPIKSNGFNIFHYFKMMIRSLLQLFRCQVNWPRTKQYSDCCEQIGLQLDITYILRKLMFLQTGLDMLFNEHHIEALYLREKPSLDKVINRRKKHFACEMIKELSNQPSKLSKEQALNQLPQKNMIDDLNSPQKEKTSLEEFSQNSSIGGLSLSQPVRMEEDFSTALQRVIDQAQSGNQMSQKIIEQVDEQLFPLVKSVKGRNKISLIKVANVQSHFYSQNRKEEPSRLSKRSGEDFIFELHR